MTAFTLLLLFIYSLSSTSLFCSGLISTSLTFTRPKYPREHVDSHPFAPSTAPAPAPFPIRQVPAPSSHPLPIWHHHGDGAHHHRPESPHAVAPSPSEKGCDQTCVDPLTSVPFGSPCGCVLPMKVRLLLDIAPYAIFPVMNELEIEIAAGTYFQQSQVKIMGASADSQNQERTVVDINLVPLGEKFDNETALLTCKRLLHKQVYLNATLFGNYEVIYISYPGLPDSPPYKGNVGSGPVFGSSASGNVGELPITADFVDKNQKINLRIIIVIIFSAFVFLLVLVGVISVFRKCRKVRTPSSAVGSVFTSSLNKNPGTGLILSSSIASSTSPSLALTMATCLLSVQRFAFADLEKATDKFSSKQILGEGGFGRVYRGTMEDGSEIAVKLLLTRDGQNGDREFIQEVEMLSRLHHRNLVKLIGICIEGLTRCLVYELIPNGSVESHLHGVDGKEGHLDWDARLKIALGAARGLAYLHEDSNPRVIHRDFKASNVLLENDFTPKVSDFGLAREAAGGSQHISTRVMGTFGYVAPEYAMTGHLLVKSDVYSYGVVLLELLTGRKPVDMSQPQGQENLVTWARPLLTSREGLQQLVDPSLAGTYEFDDIAKVAAIANMCVHPEVTHRPFMGEVVQALKLIYNDMEEASADCHSQESSAPDSDFKGDLTHDSSRWCHAGRVTPRLAYGQASSFMTMDYSSGHLEEMENRMFSASSLMGEGIALPIRHGNRSGPLRMFRSSLSLYRLRGSMSEHGGLLPRRIWNEPYWV